MMPTMRGLLKFLFYLILLALIAGEKQRDVVLLQHELIIRSTVAVGAAFQ